MINFLWLFFAFALVLLNAFFVAAEFGMVKLRHTRVRAIKTQYGWRGKILAEVHKHLDAYLSACQLGITLASLGLGWIGEPAFSHLLMPVFQFLGIKSPELIKVISFFTAFSIISFLHIVVGELMPKSLAIRQSEKVSVWTAVPLYGFYWLMYPAIWLLNTCSNFLLKKTGLDITSSSERYFSTEEIKLILNSSHLHGELTEEETEIIEHTLEFADLRVTEVMRPREEMVMLDIHQPTQLLLQTALTHRYSRYPIYDSDKKEIIGIIHVKDIFAALYQHNEIKDLTPFIRPVLKISYRMPALELLREFREGVPHFALVYKGKETLLGFVTLDNLLHILIGRIKDEFHKTQDDWVKNPDGSISVKGECSIYSLERALDREITVKPDEEDIETLVGLLAAREETFPKEGDKIKFKEFDAVVEEVRGSSIPKVRIYPKTGKAY